MQENLTRSEMSVALDLNHQKLCQFDKTHQKACIEKKEKETFGQICGTPTFESKYKQHEQGVFAFIQNPFELPDMVHLKAQAL